jgi:hypothetical protein
MVLVRPVEVIAIQIQPTHTIPVCLMTAQVIDRFFQQQEFVVTALNTLIQTPTIPNA